MKFKAEIATTVLIYIWEPHIINGKADIGHAAIQVEGHYRSIWPSRSSFPQIGLVKAMPVSSELCEQLSQDEFMQAKIEDTVYVKTPDPKQSDRPADRVFAMDGSRGDLSAMKAELLKIDDEQAKGHIGYQFFDNTQIMTAFFNDSTAYQLTLDPFSDLSIENPANRFPEKALNHLSSGLNCTSLVVRCINSGLEEKDKISTNRYFIWKKSPRRLAIDLANSSVAKEVTDLYLEDRQEKLSKHY